MSIFVIMDKYATYTRKDGYDLLPKTSKTIVIVEMLYFLRII